MAQLQFITRVVHREYFSARGLADIDREPERFGFVRPLGNDIYVFLAQDMGGAIRNVHGEHLAQAGMSADAAWQLAYDHTREVMHSPAVRQAVSHTETGKDWAVWIGEDHVPSFVLLPEFFQACRKTLKAESFMVCLASCQLVFVLQDCSKEELKAFESVVSQMLEGSQSQVSTEWFRLSAKGLTPLSGGEEQRFNVAVDGIKAGMTQDEVADALSTLFNGYERSQIMAILNRPGAVVKRGVDAATGEKYRAALEKRGCICRIVPESAVAPERSTPAPAAHEADPQSKEEQFALAVRHIQGEGVAQDLKRAAQLLLKAAEQGLAEAQNGIADMYRAGIAIAEDKTQALSWYHKAAAQNNKDALTQLGVMYFQGEGVSKNHERSAHWFGKAAELGVAGAQANLAQHYQFGLGVSKNFDLAEQWYIKAISNGAQGLEGQLRTVQAMRDQIEDEPVEEKKSSGLGQAFKSFRRILNNI